MVDYLRDLIIKRLSQTDKKIDQSLKDLTNLKLHIKVIRRGVERKDAKNLEDLSDVLTRVKKINQKVKSA